jgi:hypothetical protein
MMPVLKICQSFSLSLSLIWQLCLMMLQIVASLAENSRSVIYYRNMFIEQATTEAMMTKKVLNY